MTEFADNVVIAGRIEQWSKSEILELYDEFLIFGVLYDDIHRRGFYGGCTEEFFSTFIK
jgi:hypothetical protein